VTPAGAPGGTAPVECVVNISEGRDAGVIAAVAAAGGDCLLDVHADAEHHRAVLTLGGPLARVEDAARRVAVAAVERIDLSIHAGIHPRLGAVDVVPFVPLRGPGGGVTPWEAVVAARDAYARWSGDELGVPCFRYGSERTLPEVRRGAFTTLAPDTGPPVPHPTAGATAVGARPVLVAYNVWIAAGPDGPDPDGVVAVARELAVRTRRPGLRTLGLAVDAGAQVSCNVVDPDRIPLTAVYDLVARGAEAHGCVARRGELVGLLPDSALAVVPEGRWAELGLRAEDTIEFRLDARRG
jgi:glutamate formiminotransferase / 5-formyltetrahydrofolate cyclo-ligase